MVSAFFPLHLRRYMDQAVSDLCEELGIKLFRIERNLDQVKAVRDIYKNANDVIGKDLDTCRSWASSLIQNDGTTNFRASIHRIFKEIICEEHA